MADVTYQDDDVVYVDPGKREVIGKVEWQKNGKPKPLPMKEDPAKIRKGRIRKTYYYPWGTYRSMKKVYRLEGKIRDTERSMTLDQAIEKAMQEPYWD